MSERIFPSQMLCGQEDIAALNGSFWAIVAFYNPCNYVKNVENYHIFREWISRQNIKILCVEVAFKKSPFQLKNSDADIYIRRGTRDIIWQTERAFNIGLEYLPEDCDKVAWLDADIIFGDDQWVKKASGQLQRFKVIQLFSSGVHVPKHYDTRRAEYNSLVLKQQIGSLGKLQSDISIVRGIIEGRTPVNHMAECGHPGYAWAIRRDVIQEVKFYDRLVMGGGDLLMAASFVLGKPASNYMLSRARSIAMEKSMNDWSEHIFRLIAGSIHYVDGTVYHLWHGTMDERGYFWREGVLRRCSFDPVNDIQIGLDQCWHWSTPKYLLHLLVRYYFWMRNESGSRIRPIIVRIINRFIRLWEHGT
ncbi:MAG: hypothetical protein D4S01_01660 [Dehalococcoidia bacterium]|nr:MAG: hypothetical protein D4S01_01660 [Dehalococcoidia bacterium]